MKIRNGFVSNSSSTSFIVDKNDLSELSMKKLRTLFSNANNRQNQDYIEDTYLVESKKHFHGSLSYHSPKIRDFFTELRKSGIEIDEDE